jgi:hypothetical protein
MQKRVAEGKHGMGLPRDPKPQSQTPFGCVKVYVGEGNRKGKGTGESATEKNIALMKAWAKQGK